MVTKRDLEVAIAAYGLGRILPAGSTRAAARATVGALVRGGRVISPPVAAGAAGVGRAALGGAATLARRNPVATAGLGLLAAQQAGAFESQEQALQDAIDDAVQRAMAPVEIAQTQQFQSAVKAKAKRKVSKYSKAVKAGMKAVKASKFGGKPGKITNAKAAFATVNKVASAVNKGKKVAKTGLRGVAARAIRKIL